MGKEESVGKTEEKGERGKRGRNESRERERWEREGMGEGKGGREKELMRAGALWQGPSLSTWRETNLMAGVKFS